MDGAEPQHGRRNLGLSRGAAPAGATYNGRMDDDDPAPTTTAAETPAESEPRSARPGWHPLAWLIVGILALGVPYGLLVALAQPAGPLAATLLPLCGAGLALGIYRLLMRHLAGRPLPELAGESWPLEALGGFATGVAFVGGSAAFITLLGGYRFAWAPAGATVLAPILALHCGAAVVEELVFRGLAFQAIEELGGRWVALTATSLFFGVAHLGNPGATWWSAFAIACEAGLLLGAAFLWRRHLGFAIGLHLGWNWIEALLGIPVSGHAEPGLLEAGLAGPELLNGGAFGLEASVVPVVAGITLAVPMLLLARRRERRARLDGNQLGKGST